MQTWEKIFKEKGKFFLKPDKSISEVVRLFKRRKVERILDLGSGSGRHVVYLAKKGFDVYGLDPSKTGIAITKRWLKKEHLDANLNCAIPDKRLPYKNAFFDAVITTYALHHNYPKRIKGAIKEIERVLKSDGVLFFIVPGWKLDAKDRKTERWKMKKIAPGTYIPLTGKEKGLVHFFFNKKTIRSFFHNFNIEKLSYVKTHYYVTATKKH